VDEDQGKNRTFWASIPTRNSKDDQGPSFLSLQSYQPPPPKSKIPSCAYKYWLGDTTTGGWRSEDLPAMLWVSRIRPADAKQMKKKARWKRQYDCDKIQDRKKDHIFENLATASKMIKE
jgi:hypothetical protein